jgi:tRNA 2-thiouridine synthesizing protein A
LKTIDVRGLACPEPIVIAKRALVDDGEPAVLLLVDSAVTRENLQKFAASKGFAYEEQGGDGQWRIGLTGFGATSREAASPALAPKAPPVVLCRRQTFGAESGQLGGILIRAFFKTLLDLDVKPGKVIFVNEGVFLPCRDEQVIEYCRKLADLGVEVLSCGTCLDYFKLIGAVKVGRVGNMYDIAGALLAAGHVVEP